MIRGTVCVLGTIMMIIAAWEECKIFRADIEAARIFAENNRKAY